MIIKAGLLLDASEGRKGNVTGSRKIARGVRNTLKESCIAVQFVVVLGSHRNRKYFTTTVSTILTTTSLASVSPSPSEVPSNEIVEWVLL